MKEKISFIYKVLILIACGFGLYLNFSFLSIKDSLVYYTIQSNIICFIFYFIIIILYVKKRLIKNNLYYILKGMVTMAITVTMFVYQIVISTSGGISGYENHELACTFVHLVVPIMIIFDYIIFGEKGKLKKDYPFIWSITLIWYVLFDIIYVFLGGTFVGGTKYPYFYMDISKYGLFGVIINCVIIYIFFVGYGVIIQVLDNKVAKEQLKVGK